MDVNRIIAAVDHTLLSPAAVWPDVKKLCDEAMEYGAASVCVPPCHVRDAAAYVGGALPVCTVIGFPNGYSSGSVKLFEAKTAIMDGASEIDMVINLSWLKERRYDRVFSEINGVKAMIGEENILKVIVETHLLTGEETLRMGELTAQSGANFIAVSTGVFAEGASPEDVALLRHGSQNLKIKASGGVSTPEDAWQLLAAGASRLGSGRILPLLKERKG